MEENPLSSTGRAFSSEGYQGETLQVFLFYRGQYLGFQCFAQQKITVGGTPRMDLYLPDCTPEEGYWGFSVSGGALHAWYRNPVQSPGFDRGEAPRRVASLDTFPLGEYRLQLNILHAQSFTLHCQELKGTAEEGKNPAAEPESGFREPDPLETPDSMSLVTGNEQDQTREEEEEGPAPEPESLTREPDPPQTPDGVSLLAGVEQAQTQEDEEKPAVSPFPEDTEEKSGFFLETDEAACNTHEAMWLEEDPELTGNKEHAAGFQGEIEIGEQKSHPECEPSESGCEGTHVEGSGNLAEETYGMDWLEEAFESACPAPRCTEKLKSIDSVAVDPAPAGIAGQEDPGEICGHSMPEEQREEGVQEEGGEREEECAPGEETVDGDEEDEGPEICEYFSLVRTIFPSSKAEPRHLDADQRALEVIRYRAGDVQEIACLQENGSFSIRRGWSRRLWKREGGPRPGFRMVSYKKGGTARIQIQDGVHGRFYSNLGSRDVRDCEGPGRKGAQPRSGAFQLSLPADAWAVLRVEPYRYLVRYIPGKPVQPVPLIRPRVSKGQFKLVSASLACHLVLILTIGLVVPDKTLEGYSRQDRFARIGPEVLNELKPPPRPKPAVKPRKLELQKPETKAIRTPKRKLQPTFVKKRVQQKSTGNRSESGSKDVDVSQTGLLATLGGGGTGAKGNAGGKGKILLAAVTNLDAVAVPSGASTFNMAGIAGKLETSEIQVPTSDVIQTVGAQELMAASGGALGTLASKGSGRVKGVVKEPPKTTISIRGGMSRETVLRVVTAHLDEIRDCYERELLHHPGLTGKILLEWMIQKDGTVRYATVKFSNIGHSTDLNTCIPSQVRTWKFPKPTNNEEVIVTFPFLFESLGF